MKISLYLLRFQGGKQGWRGSFHVVTTPCGTLMIPSLVTVFPWILKKSSSV